MFTASNSRATLVFLKKLFRDATDWSSCSTRSINVFHPRLFMRVGLRVRAGTV